MYLITYLTSQHPTEVSDNPKEAIAKTIGCRPNSLAPMYQDRNDGSTYQSGFVIGDNWIQVDRIQITAGVG